MLMGAELVMAPDDDGGAVILISGVYLLSTGQE
jgi:hypothetical protein